MLNPNEFTTFGEKYVNICPNYYSFSEAVKLADTTRIHRHYGYWVKVVSNDSNECLTVPKEHL
jgi:hypothetical protein